LNDMTANTADTANPASPDAVRPRILLAEPDNGVRRSLQLLLQARGYDVRAHASGRTLLDDPLSPGAVCLVADNQLESPDGFEILSRLRARGWSGPAILITAAVVPGLQDRAAGQGFCAVIEKPFREGAVSDTIARLLRAH